MIALPTHANTILRSQLALLVKLAQNVVCLMLLAKSPICIHLCFPSQRLQGIYIPAVSMCFRRQNMSRTGKAKLLAETILPAPRKVRNLVMACFWSHFGITRNGRKQVEQPCMYSCNDIGIGKAQGFICVNSRPFESLLCGNYPSSVKT